MQEAQYIYLAMTQINLVICWMHKLENLHFLPSISSAYVKLWTHNHTLHYIPKLKRL